MTIWETLNYLLLMMKRVGLLNPRAVNRNILSALTLCEFLVPGRFVIHIFVKEPTLPDPLNPP